MTIRTRGFVYGFPLKGVYKGNSEKDSIRVL